MLASHPQPMSIEDFFHWLGRQHERHELAGGFPVRMTAGAKQSHNVVVGNLVGALLAGAKASGCRTTSSDTAVVTGTGSVRYPDVVVDCGPPDPDAMTASGPTIVVEVLSKSTSQIDFSDKLDEYKGHASIGIILLIDPDTVAVKVYRRTKDRDWIAERYDGLDDVIALPPVATALRLADIYDTLAPKRRPGIGVVGNSDAAD